MFMIALASAFFGAVVGLVLGCTGAGGGALAVPVLIGLLGWPVSQATPVSLLAVGSAAALGSAGPLRRHEVHGPSVALLGLGGLVGGPLGLRAAAFLPRQAIALGLVAVAAWLAWQAWKPKPRGALSAPTHQASPAPLSAPPAARPYALVAIGLVSGAVGGLLGIGGGFVLVPALVRWGGCGFQRAIPTSLAVIAIVSLSTWAWSLPGSLSLPSGGAWFVGAVIAGLLLGRRWSAGWSSRSLQRAFTALLLLVALAACVS